LPASICRQDGGAPVLPNLPGLFAVPGRLDSGVPFGTPTQNDGKEGDRRSARTRYPSGFQPSKPHPSVGTLPNDQAVIPAGIAGIQAPGMAIHYRGLNPYPLPGLDLFLGPIKNPVNPGNPVNLVQLAVGMMLMSTTPNLEW